MPGAFDRPDALRRLLDAEHVMQLALITGVASSERQVPTPN